MRVCSLRHVYHYFSLLLLCIDCPASSPTSSPKLSITFYTKGQANIVGRYHHVIRVLSFAIDFMCVESLRKNIVKILSELEGTPNGDQIKGDDYEEDYIHRSAGFFSVQRTGLFLYRQNRIH